MWLVRMLMALVVVVAAASPAMAAADPGDVADIVADNGFYVEPGASATDEEISDLVTVMRNAGEAFSVIILSAEPPGGAVTFADAVLDDLGDDNHILVVSPDSYGISGNPGQFTEAEISTALDAAAVEETDADLVNAYVTGLLGTEVVPAPSGTSTAGDRGGISILPIILIGGVLLLGWMWWRRKAAASAGSRIDARLAEAKTAVQTQIDAVANDIIDLEDDVRVAGNSEATGAYNAAGQIYNEVTDAYPGATTAQGLLDLSNRLDEAVWQLDTTEALIDGKTPPPRPQPQVLEEVRAPDIDDGRLPERPDYGGDGPERPDYERRQSRRSSYGGGGLMNILIGLGGLLLANRSRGGGGGGGLGDILGGLGRSVGGRGTTVRPPAPTYPRIDLQKPSASRPRTSSGGRVRMGRRRGR